MWKTASLLGVSWIVDTIAGVMRVGWFVFWRAWWGAAVGVSLKVYGLGGPDWLANSLGPAMGQHFAWRMCRLSGWSGRVGGKYEEV